MTKQIDNFMENIANLSLNLKKCVLIFISISFHTKKW